MELNRLGTNLWSVECSEGLIKQRKFKMKEIDTDEGYNTIEAAGFG
jgi:hypothetical protein